MKLRALKNGFDGFKRIYGPKADGSTEGEVFEHTRLTLQEKEVTVGVGPKAKQVKKFILPAWCDVVNEKDRDKFIFQGDRAAVIQKNIDNLAAEVEKKNQGAPIPAAPAAPAPAEASESILE